MFYCEPISKNLACAVKCIALFPCVKILPVKCLSLIPHCAAVNKQHPSQIIRKGKRISILHYYVICTMRQVEKAGQRRNKKQSQNNPK